MQLSFSCWSFDIVSLAKKLEEMAAQGRQRTLIPRGAPASAIPCHKLSELAKMDGVAPQKKEQCDSGFGDDEELRSERLQSDGEVRSLEQTTQNLSIEDPSERPDERQPSSLEQEDGRTETAHTGGHFLNFAQCNDVRYLLAPVREGLFLQDQDGDTYVQLHFSRSASGHQKAWQKCRSFISQNTV